MEELIRINGEPPEVAEIRDKILTTFNELIFVEEGHKYYLRGEELESVSNITHMFKEEFDTEEQAIKYALKHGETPEYWKDKWKYNSLKATTTGTLVHSFGESMAWVHFGVPEKITPECKSKYYKEKNWLLPTRTKEEAVINFFNDLPKEFHLVLTETKVYSSVNPDLPKFSKNYAGTFDLLFYYKHPTDDSKSGLLIYDWKGLPLDTPIATTNGWKTMGTIQEGDFVFDKNGHPTKVLHTSSIHHNPCYKIVFDNDEIIADCDHRWEISFKKKKIKDGKSYDVYENKVMTTLELKSYLDTLTKRYAYNIPKICIAKPIDTEEKQLPIDPYVFGLWLGDGHKADGKITNMYNEIWGEIKKRGYELGEDVSQGASGKAQTRNIKGLFRELRLLGCQKNKHIPDIYMFSSYNQRLDLLRGLMDSDGYYNPARKRYVMCTTQKWQADYTLRLLSTLGVKATYIESFGKCSNGRDPQKRIKKYDVSFNSDFYPFLVRKIDVKPLKFDKKTYRNVVSVEEVEMVPTRCIEVESETHTFCCGYNMLVTHNTNKELTNTFSREKGKMLFYPFDDLYDESLGLYSIQQSCYQIPLEDIGLKVIGRRLVWLKDDGTYENVKLKDYTKQLRDVLR